VDKIKIKNNSFEIPYLDEKGKNYYYVYSNERVLLNEIIALISDYSCFVKSWYIEDEAFEKYNIKNYYEEKNHKYMEMESFEGLNDKMFEPRGTIISLASKDYTWEEFLKPSRYSYKKKKLVLILNEFGFIDVYYSNEYKEKIENIIENYNSKIPDKPKKNIFRRIIDYIRFS